jgi:hypothetical protein
MLIEHPLIQITFGSRDSQERRRQTRFIMFANLLSFQSGIQHVVASPTQRPIDLQLICRCSGAARAAGYNPQPLTARRAQRKQLFIHIYIFITAIANSSVTNTD